MTWITDGSGTRWVPQQTRKRRKPGVPKRFAELKAGDILIHRAKVRSTFRPRLGGLVAANEEEEITTHTGFALCLYRWRDPVAGHRDHWAGEMAGVVSLGSHGWLDSPWAHTLRGLASQGYDNATPEQAKVVRRFADQRAWLVSEFEAGNITRAEAQARAISYRDLYRDTGIEASFKEVAR